MRGIQKVRRLTQLITRYVPVCHLLSLFSILSCNWSALGMVSFQSLHSIVEESLILLFQPAIFCADNVVPCQNCPFPCSDLEIYYNIHRSLGPPAFTYPKRHLSWFSCFSMAHSHKRQTNHPTPICNTRPHLHSSEVWHNNKLPRMELGHSLSPLSIHFLIFCSFLLFPFLICFSYFLLSIHSLSTRIVPLHFQTGGRRKRPNLGLACCVYFVLFVLLT